MSSETLSFEYQIFALAFKTPGAISHFVQTLPTEDVGLVDGNVGLNQFYIALCDFYDRTGLDPIEPVAFKSWLEVETEIGLALGGPDGVDSFLEMLNGLELSTPEAAASIVRFRASKKRQQEYADELKELLVKKDVTEAERIRIGLLSTMINTLSNETGQDPMSSVMTGDDLADIADSLWDLPDFLPTGTVVNGLAIPFTGLNKALGYTEKGGVVKGALTAILAPSGKGKSTFAKCLANYWVKTGHRVLYVNYEEVASHWNRILMTQITGQNIYLSEEIDDLTKKHCTELFKKEMRDWGGRLMVRHDPDTAYFEDLEYWIRDMMAKTDVMPDAIIIDTIQSMFMKGGAGKPRWGQFEEMMVRLEKLGKDTGCALVITAQENTNRMKEKRDVVMQSDTGGSIAIVQKCSVTMHLVDRVVNGDESAEETVCDIQVPKNRITGTAFSHKPPAVKYNDETKSFIPYEPLDDPRYEPNQEFDIDELFDPDDFFG